MLFINTDQKLKRGWVLFSLLMLLMMATSCEKENFEENPAIIQTFNALDNNLGLYTNLSVNRPAIFGTARELANKDSLLEFNMLTVTEFPQPLQLYAKTDTTPDKGPLINAMLDLEKGQIYSLFVHGNKSSADYTLFHEKFPPLNIVDSSCNIRFANFSSVPAISVNLKGELPGSFIQSISNQTRSEFFELPFNYTTDKEYEFEFRDQASGDLLCSYKVKADPALAKSLSRWLFRFTTMVLTGHKGTPAPDHLKITALHHRFSN